MKVLFVPSIGLDTTLLDRLAGSIDYTIPFKVVLNNGPEGALDKWSEEWPDWIVKEPTCGNRGVAGSWNYAAELFPDESILIANEDAWFLPGQLEQICSASDHNQTEPLIYMNDSQAFYCFVWHKAGREQYGTFDENFWPAYYEDCDYRARMRLNGKVDYVYALQDKAVVPHGKPRSGGDNYSALINGCGLFGRAYWRKKWGTDSYEEAVYQTPYRDHRLTYKDWVYDPALRAEIFPIWQRFLAFPNPSIYE